MSAVPDFPLPPHLAVAEEPFDDTDLSEYLDPVSDLAVDYERTDRVATFRVEADDQAEWAARKLAIAHAEVEQARQQADEWIARIRDNFERTTRLSQGSVTFFEGLLQDYAMRIREVGGPVTLNLPSATISTTVQKARVVVGDDDELATRLKRRLDEVDGDNLASAAAWGKALTEAGLDLDDLIHETAKVYVVPLRKLVHVEEVHEDLWDWHVILDCGHQEFGDEPVSDPEDFAIPSRGDKRTCYACPAAIEGWGSRTVEAIVTRQRKRLAAFGPDGVEVPGCDVSEEQVTATVKVR